ncbi:MAG: polysaccharide deacetylase family protein [Steroidobacteraceae bacterium]
MLYYSGFLWLIAEFRLRGKAAVLMYHRVLPAGADTFSHYGIVISPETFARQMQFLKRHFRLLTSDQFGAELTGPGFGRRSCLVTFDDGWQDNHRHALPVLKKLGIPAVVFVATAFVGTSNTFWQERLTRLLFLASRSPSFGDDVLRELDALDSRSMDDAAAEYRLRNLVTTLKLREPMIKERLIQRLEADARSAGLNASDLGEDRFLSWDEVRELQNSGVVTIGSHAHTHTPLPSLGYAGAKIELARAQQELREHGIPPTAICAYPNGNVDEAVAAAARDAGITLGFATGHGRVSNGDDPLRLRRINVHDRSSFTRAEFLCLILGVF